jgi:organic radical activating enzyme
MKKETFCPVPWIHLHVLNNGLAFPCCMTPLDDANQLGNVRTQPLLEIMNSDIAKSMRANMIAGNALPKSCHRCTDKEALGMNTMRTGMVDHYLPLIQDEIANTAVDGTIPEVKLLYWDFRFSNFCNLSCRTCSPLFSTSWDKDYTKLNNTPPTKSPLINLEDADLFWKELELQLPYVESIHFAGGEPVIMEEHWRLIDMLIAKGLTNLELHYSTNATSLKFKNRSIIDIWKKFKRVQLSLSIDGSLDAFEYVRNRGKWPETEKNLIAIKDANLDFWIHPTVSILNIYRLTELHDRLLEIEVIGITSGKKRDRSNYFVTQFHINPLFTPEYYSLTSLPMHHKIAIRKKLTEYADKMYVEYDIPKAGWHSIINYMESCDTSHLWSECVSMTNQLDNLRNQSFIKINPEFANDFPSTAVFTGKVLS